MLLHKWFDNNNAPHPNAMTTCQCIWLWNISTSTTVCGFCTSNTTNFSEVLYEQLRQYLHKDCGSFQATPRTPNSQKECGTHPKSPWRPMYAWIYSANPIIIMSCELNHIITTKHIRARHQPHMQQPYNT